MTHELHPIWIFVYGFSVVFIALISLMWSAKLMSFLLRPFIRAEMKRTRQASLKGRRP